MDKVEQTGLTAAGRPVTGHAMEKEAAADDAPDATARAMAHARRRHQRRGKKLLARVARTASFLGTAFVVALVVRSFIVQPFIIPSGSMSPLLTSGDFVLVNKAAYGWTLASLPLAGPLATDRDIGGWRIAPKPVRPGDVIVFIAADGRDYVKRMIAGEGSRVAMRDGKLQLNGRLVDCVPLGDGLCRETLPGGASHVVRTDGSGAFANMAEIVIPPGHYFVLGDNRDHSADSRLSRTSGGVGLVANTNVIGRATRIFFSAHHGIHWNRIGKSLD